MKRQQRIRMVVTMEGGEVEEMIVRGQKDWLDTVNELMKLRRYGGNVIGIDSYAGGNQIGSWHVTESVLTPEQVEEGRQAFMDDLTIKAVAG
jgi:hypothetical protein